MNEITHSLDTETRLYRQLVTPTRLREILDLDGDDYSRPSGFGDGDEWDVGEELTP
jgi:hypothetical protein